MTNKKPIDVLFPPSLKKGLLGLMKAQLLRFLMEGKECTAVRPHAVGAANMSLIHLEQTAQKSEKPTVEKHELQCQPPT